LTASTMNDCGAKSKLSAPLIYLFYLSKTGNYSNIGAGYYKERRVVEEEIRQRQERWRSQAPDSPRRIPPSEEPPPTSY
jgi:hypothetical protein